MQRASDRKVIGQVFHGDRNVSARVLRPLGSKMSAVAARDLGEKKE